MDLERPLYYRREGEIDQAKVWKRGCLCTRILKVESVGKRKARREFLILEVMKTNVLANEVVRYFFNLTVNGCWESAKVCNV